jgi:hypothetical protein
MLSAKKNQKTLEASSEKTIKLSLAKLVKSLKAGSALTSADFDRPHFNAIKERAARLEAALATQNDHYLKANLDINNEDLAAPHRAPYARLRDTVLDGTSAKVEDVVGQLAAVSMLCEDAFRLVKSDSRFGDLADLYKKTRVDVEKALYNYNVHTLKPGAKFADKLELIRALNNLASNAPGLGPHSGTNALVSDRLHLHLTDLQEEPVTPRGKAANSVFPSEPVATVADKSGDRKIVSVTGAHHSLQPGQTVPHFHDISVKPGILRGALYVDQMKVVYRPRNPKMAPTGIFENDWERVL